MLTCREVAEQADAYLDGETGILDGLRILVHLKACQGCNRFVRQMVDTRSLIEDAQNEMDLALPDGRLVELMKQLEDHKKAIRQRQGKLTMNNIINGMIAGFAATVALSVLMIMKTMMGVMPELDVISMLSSMMGAPSAMGWIGHFVIGTVAWGAGFAIVKDMLPVSGNVAKGIVFGIGAWLMMMIAVMPMAGAGLFGMNFGMMAPVMTLMLHIVFGYVLGKVYDMRTA